MTTKQLIIEVQLVLNSGVAAQLHHAEQTILSLPSSCVLMELCPPLLLWIPPSLSFPAQLLSPKLSLNQNKQKGAALSWHLETMSLFPLLPYSVLCCLLAPAGFSVTPVIKQQQQMTHRGPDWTFLFQN